MDLNFNSLKNVLKFDEKMAYFRGSGFGHLTEQFGRTGSAENDRRFGRTVRVGSIPNVDQVDYGD